MNSLLTATRTHVPSVTDWFALTVQFPEYRRASATPIKDYGYMAIMAEVLKRNRNDKCRVLEFGHMFNNELFLKLEDQVEIWGMDDVGSEHYIPQGDAWEAHYKYWTDQCKNTHFVRGYLGRDMDKLPANYFDVICSVSVYDNIPFEFWPSVTEHALSALKPGGVFINTYDYAMKYREDLIKKFLETQCRAGFEVADLSELPNDDQQLIESQFSVMVYYQQAEPEEGRRYMGNFSTVLTVAQKIQ
jgi:hypothetical protein